MRKKNQIIYILLILFILFSFLFISPKARRIRTGYHSSQLKRTTEQEGSIERTDFRDGTGQITNAADLGYSTCITEMIGNTRVEKFYNDQGEPVRRYPGYFGLLREYDKAGNMIQLTYLDREGEPCITGYGYATEKREYNSARKVVSVRYYDTTGSPVFTQLYGCGRINEYDEFGNNIRITYLDASGLPVMTSLGYAFIIRRFYSNEGPEKGKVESEFYFNENGKPTALSLGEYGIHKEYNQSGQISIITYLDADGKPIVTNKGYTTIHRTFHADNSIATEQYYDLEGEPFSLAEGQYGIQKEGGQVTYLNENGQEIFSIKRFLYNHSRIVIPLAIMFVIFSALTGRKQNIYLLLLYITVIIYMTLLFRNSGEASFSGFLRYYRRFFTNSTARADIIKNVWLFIPLGAVLYRLYPKKEVLFIPFILSIMIEGIQWLAGIGTCELDDVISNSLGGWIGFFMGKLTTDIKLRINSRKQIHYV